jgi:hypothetical protein
MGRLGMRQATARRRVVPAVGFDLAAFPVHIVRPRPIAERMIGTRLVATFRRCVEDAVDSKHLLSAAAVRRVGVEDLASFVLVKNAPPRQVLDIGRPFRRGSEIVLRAPGGDVLRLERDIEVIVEVLPKEETQRNFQSMRLRTTSISSIGARATTA